MRKESSKEIVIPIQSEAELEQTQYISWKDVSYTVKIKKSSKTIISGMNGCIRKGEVVAILGGSGAGKSTLLNCISGRLEPGKLEGEILYNGRPRDPKTWKKSCAYVEQDDIMYWNLTVYETLYYAAVLRLPKELSKAEKLTRVEKIIQQLSLEKCRDTRIGGGDGIKGISGGERKRVAIGIELVTDPDVLFLDEPTSGLDSFNALNVVQTCKTLAQETGKLILMTIHQPRTDILETFDKIILLSSGKTVYFGSLESSLTYFADLGYQLPPKTNPSDYFLDIITPDQRSGQLKEESNKRIEFFQSSWEKRSEQSKSGFPTTIIPDYHKPNFPNRWYSEVFYLLDRNMKDVFRDKATLGATIGQNIIMVLLMGFVFYQVTMDAAGVQNRIGVLFFICVNQTFSIVMPALGIFPLQRLIIKRERAAGSYRSTSAYVAKIISTVPLTVAGALVLILPLYWMVGLQPILSKYLIYILILVIHSLVSNALGILIGSTVSTVQVGQIVGPLVIVVFLIFGGNLVNLDKVPVVLRWIQHISPIAYSNKALTQNEFKGLIFDECQQGQVCYNTGETVLDSFSLGSPSIEMSLLYNCCIAAGFLLLGFFFFNRTSAPLMKLK